MTSTISRRGFLGTSAVLVGASALGCSAERAIRSRPVRTAISRSIERLVPGRPGVDGAGVSLLKHLGHAGLRNLDPFVMLDEIHSDDPSRYEAGFPSHPHRGFETVSILLEGAFRHRDSRGNSGLITGGGAQWMTAGSGIVHSEMPEPPAGSTEVWGFQLWVLLPAAERMRAPEYQDIAPARIAEVELDRGGRARVIAGEALGVRGPVSARATQPLLVTLHLQPGDDVELSVGREHTAFAVVGEGAAAIGDRGDRLEAGGLAVLSGGGDRVRLRADDREAHVLVVAGQPLHEPFVQRGPFVMGTEREIEEAFADYRAGRLG